MLPPIAPAICASSVRGRPLSRSSANRHPAIDPGIRVAGHRHLPEPPRCQRARGLAVRHDRLLLAPRTNDVGNCKLSSGTSAAKAWKATTGPFPDSADQIPEFVRPCLPLVRTVARTVVRAVRSRTNTSLATLVSPGTRFEALEMKATRLPSPEMAVRSQDRSGSPPSVATVTRSVVPA